MRTIPIAEWGRDHWSLLGYIECRCVDYKGVLDTRHMRCNPSRHPGVALPQHRQGSGPYPYPTRLAEGRTESEHDDHDCFEDLEAAGLVEDVGTGVHPAARMTPKGLEVAATLRAHKTNGGSFATFSCKG